MKKMFILSMLISLAMICSCQKQDSTAETQLAQRKVELDSREQALDERERAVAQREKAIAEREKAVTTNPIIQSQRQAPDAAQAEAERQRRIQQLPPELRALVPDRSRMDTGKAEKNPAANRSIQTQRSFENSRKKKGMTGAIASPEANSPEVEAPSVSPSSTPQ